MGVFKNNAVTVYFLDTDKNEITTTENIHHRVWHREDGPAHIRNGIETWYTYGMLHRNDDGPAETIISGNEKIEKWFKENRLHRRNNLPAVIWRINDKITMEKYIVRGVLHRTNGPAWVDYANEVTAFFVNGNEYTNRAFDYCEKYGIDPFNMDEGDMAIMEMGIDAWTNRNSI